MINRIADLRRIGGIRHRFDTEQPTLLDLEVINRALGKNHPTIFEELLRLQM